MPSAILWTELYELSGKAARRFGFRTPRLEPLSRARRCKLDGAAFRGKHPCIQLRIHRYHRPTQPLKRSTIMATLAHELAHLVRGCWDHGPVHRAKTVEVAAWLRAQGQPVSTRLHTGSYPRQHRRRR